MESKNQTRKYLKYNSILKAVKRAGLKNPGKIASLLLKVLVEEDGHFKSDYGAAAGLCRSGEDDRRPSLPTYTEFRQSLIDAGLLRFNTYDSKFTTSARPMNFIGVRPGPAIERSIQKELAARSGDDPDELRQRMGNLEDELGQVKDELEKVKSEALETRTAVAWLIEMYNPPVTPEKIERALKLVK